MDQATRDELMQFEFWADGRPVPKQSVRKGRGMWYTPKRQSDWQQYIGWHARMQMAGAELMDAPLIVKIIFHLPDHRRVDLDNLAKPVLDACNGVVWKDDSQIMRLVLEKRTDDEHPAGVLVQALEMVEEAKGDNDAT